MTSTTADQRQAAILRALHLICAQPPIEIRALIGKRTDFRRYADYRSAAMFVLSADDDVQTRGIYAVINAFDESRISGIAVDDGAVIRRHRLIVDVDPDRPAKLNASDDEKGHAHSIVRAIRADLAERGWPEPAFADSGNGYHLIFAIDLPNDEASRQLIEDVLNALAARYDTAEAHVDTTMANASRITKLYGTMTRKGEPTNGRPHRRSVLLHCPSPLVPVSRNLLQQLVDEQPHHDPGDEQPEQHKDSRASVYDVAAILAKLTGVKQRPTRNGIRYYQITCPWEKEHTTGTSGTVFTVGSDGALGFKCQHQHCKDRHWPQLRDYLGIKPTAQQTHAQLVKREVERLRAQRAAKRQVDAEEHTPPTPPEFLTLRERLARPREPLRWRITQLQTEGQRVLLAAAFKSGKTTMVGSLARSLLDGSPFLDTFDVGPVVGAVAVLDFEMSSAQLDTWYEAHGIVNDDRLILMSLRGAAGSFNLLDPAIRSQWAAEFKARHVGYLIVDCLRPVLDALGLDENSEVGAFLTALDAMMLEAGIREALVVHHMGHANERARGSSRLLDWPDVSWTLVREENGGPAAARYFSAYGRDVEVPETQLAYNAQTRRLGVAGGSRRDVKKEAALVEICDVLREAKTPLSGRQIEDALADSDHASKAIRAALKLGISRREILVEPGPRNAKHHRLADAGLWTATTAETVTM